MTGRATVDGRALSHALAEQMPEPLRRTAEEIRSLGEHLSPARTGYFLGHWYVVPFRTFYRVWNNDPFAHLVEWGSVNNPAYAPFRNAVQSSNLRFVEAGRGVANAGNDDAGA